MFRPMNPTPRPLRVPRGLAVVSFLMLSLDAPLLAAPANTLPVVTRRVPAADPAAVNEGAALTFSLTAHDATDPNAAQRGMVSITWLVDGTERQVTRTGAPNAVASSFVFRTDAATVSGAPFRDVAVEAVATDRQGGATTVRWTVRVNNVAAAQRISWKALPAMAPGDADLALSATASSGLPVQYQSSYPAVAQVLGGVVRAVSPGTAVITATQAGSVDFQPAAASRQSLTVRARVTAAVPDGGGTVSGVGLYAPGSVVNLRAQPDRNFSFLRWEDGSQAPVRRLALTSPVTAVTAFFKRSDAVAPAVVADPGAQTATVGVPYNLPLQITSESLPTVTVSGLPAGLRFDPATRTISGVPTVSGSGKSVTVTVRNAHPTASVRAFPLTVNALPGWARGNYAGWSDSTGRGTAALTVSAQGAFSGRLVAEGKSWSFTAPAFAALDVAGARGSVNVVARSGAATLPLLIAITRPPARPDLPPGFAKAEIFLASAPGIPVAQLYRSFWKDPGMESAILPYAAYYTAGLVVESGAGDGFLGLTVDKAGTTVVAGKLADGTPVTLSQPLLYDEGGRHLVVLHASPPAYRGGSFYLLAEFDRPDDGGPVVLRSNAGDSVWESRNPVATESYEEGGFSRTVEIIGGRYDPSLDLRALYPGGLVSGADSSGLSLLLPVRITDYDTDSLAEFPPVVTTTEWRREAASGPSPEGLSISITPATGVGTGLLAPKFTPPVRIFYPETGEVSYEYEGDNPSGLTVSINRATGKFTGSFNVYFDYTSAENNVSMTMATSHVVRRVAIEGMLIPVRGDDTNIEGRGFYLWADRASYLDAAEREIFYSFNGSHDFRLTRP